MLHLEASLGKYRAGSSMRMSWQANDNTELQFSLLGEQTLHVPNVEKRWQILSRRAFLNILKKKDFLKKSKKIQEFKEFKEKNLKIFFKEFLNILKVFLKLGDVMKGTR